MIVSGTFGLIGIEDGIGYEDIYTLTTGGTAPSKPASENVNDYVPSGWYASPQSVTSTKRYQWVCKRSKKNGTWSAWSTPVEYNRYVEDGQDGTDGTDGTDGVGYEYCYKATQYNVRPDIPISEASGAGIPTGWSSSAPDISAINAYIWESYRTVQGSSRSYWQTPKLKNRWANDGANGAKGAKMRMRTWESGVKYLQGAEGEEFYDIVVYETKLYLCTKTHTSSSSNNPIESIEGYLGYWESAQQWTFVATQLLLAEKINASMIDADGITAKNVNLTGKITATSGKIGGWSISGNNLICNGYDTKIKIEASGTRFMRINDSESTMCRIRADGSTALDVDTYGNSDASVGIRVLCNASGYGKAIEAYGNIKLHARYNEYVSVKGVAFNVRDVSSSQDVYDNDDYIFASGTITLKLPTPQRMAGKVYHIKRGNGNVTLTSYYISGTIVKPFILKDGRNDYLTVINTNDMHSYVSNGVAWYEMIS